jgi:hypothetical protein
MYMSLLPGVEGTMVRVRTVPQQIIDYEYLIPICLYISGAK